MLAAKDKVVRFRATQLIAHIVNSVDSIDDDLFHSIRQSLAMRIRDKEASVRVQAVVGLGRLVSDEDEDGKGDSLMARLLEVLQNDTSAEVRRTLLLTLPLTPLTLPFLLERARDVDAPTRRALYSKLLPTLGDFRHLALGMREKMLRWGLRDRDENVRKAAGRLFCERWVEDCATTQRAEAREEDDTPDSSRRLSALVELLERIDVVNSGFDGGIAHEAMAAFWDWRPDYREAVEFGESFWRHLTPESAFVARSFNDYCRGEDAASDESRAALADDKMPEVTAVAYFLGLHMAELLEKLARMREMTVSADEDPEMIEAEFVVEQLLHIALTLDYSDEAGRRQMAGLLRETLAVPDLPEDTVRLVVDCLRAVCPPGAAGEREFCGVVLEAIAEVHDTLDSFVSAQENEEKENDGDDDEMELDDEDEDRPPNRPFNKEAAKARVLQEIIVNMKCLAIARNLLANVSGRLRDSPDLVTLLNNLVVPAVRSHEAPVRERGLACLGLACLLDRALAEENVGLFVHCFSRGHEALQVMSVEILADILTVHQGLLAGSNREETGEAELGGPPPFQRPLLKLFARAVKPGAVPDSVAATAAVSLSKLLLTDALVPPMPQPGPGQPLTPEKTQALMRAQAQVQSLDAAADTLTGALALAFFHPRTRPNAALRQALAYFWPVYAHSRLNHTARLGRVTVAVLRAVLAGADEYYSIGSGGSFGEDGDGGYAGGGGGGEDSDGNVDSAAGEREVRALMSTVVGVLAEWTDDRRVVGLAGSTPPGSGADPITGSDSNALAIAPVESVHFRLARDLLRRLVGAPEGTPATADMAVTPPHREERKWLLALLGKLHVPPPTVEMLARGEKKAAEKQGRARAQREHSIVSTSVVSGAPSDGTAGTRTTGDAEHPDADPDTTSVTTNTATTENENESTAGADAEPEAASDADADAGADTTLTPVSDSDTPAEPPDPDTALVIEVKALLDAAIGAGTAVAADASGRNALVRVKNAVLKLVTAVKGTAKSSGQRRRVVRKGISKGS